MMSQGIIDVTAIEHIRGCTIELIFQPSNWLDWGLTMTVSRKHQNYIDGKGEHSILGNLRCENMTN